MKTKLKQQICGGPGAFNRKRVLWLGLSRRIVLLLLVAAIFDYCSAFSVRSETIPTVRVRVVNYTQATPATVAAAESGAGQILRDAGLNVVWSDCRVIESLDDPTEFCRQPLSPAEILLRLLPENSRHGIADDAFGFAVPPVLASIYYQHAVLLAASTGYGLPGILACVIAHELGHLLLGPRSHSEIGIMRGHWGRNELRLIAWGGLHFTPQQGKAIRAEAQVRMRRETTGIIVASSVDYDGRR